MPLCSTLTPPDWRFEVATALAAGQPPRHGLPEADAAVERAVAALRGNPTKMTAEALKLRDGRPMVVGEIQARCIAGQSPAAIAKAVGIPAAVVGEYLNLFFDAGPRLDNEGWLFWAAGGYHRAAFRAMTDPAAILRYIAFRCGRDMLEMFLLYFKLGLHEQSDAAEHRLFELSPEERASMLVVRQHLRLLADDLTDPVTSLVRLAEVQAEMASIRAETGRDVNNRPAETPVDRQPRRHAEALAQIGRSPATIV